MSKYNLEFVEKQAKILLERDKHHNPLAIMLRKGIKGKKNDIFFAPMTFNNDKEKREFQIALRDVVTKEKITKYWLIMESWVSSNVHVEKPSRDINRKEALVITEFSKENPQGRMVFNAFSRKDDNIVWGKRDVLDSSKEKQGLQSSWNFFLEDISDEEWIELKEKTRRKDMLHRLERSDITEEYEQLKEEWKKDVGTEFPIPKEQVKKVMLKLAKEGKIGFRNGIIPENLKEAKDEI